MTKLSPDSAAGCIARLLRTRGIDRVFALCGGHIMPIWMRLDTEGIRIVDVRDERAAVHMAQAHAELTGQLGVSLVLAELDEAIARALGECGEPGPAYIDFPVDTLRTDVPKALQLDEHIAAK